MSEVYILSPFLTGRKNEVGGLVLLAQSIILGEEGCCLCVHTSKESTLAKKKKMHVFTNCLLTHDH